MYLIFLKRTKFKKVEAELLVGYKGHNCSDVIHVLHETVVVFVSVSIKQNFCWISKVNMSLICSFSHGNQGKSAVKGVKVDYTFFSSACIAQVK